jgi:RsiW-degrading membrane proteinase PrsW (M82 family)
MLIQIALGIAFIVPLIYLFAVRKFDLFRTGRFSVNIVTVIWGIIAYLLAVQINTTVIDMGWATRTQVIRSGAPIVEEILKGLILIYLVQRADFNYIVDGAIYGFGAGIGFAMVENYEYVMGHQEIALSVAVARVFSTNLVHATASGVIGTALAYRRGDSSWKGWFFILLGYTFSISYHMGFNTMVNSGGYLIFAIIFGFVGAGLIWYAIRRGLYAQKKWVGEKLTEADRATKSETKALTRIEELNREILAPVEKQFGAEKAGWVHKMLLKQAEMGIKRKLLDSTPSENKRKEIEVLIEDIKREVKALRDQIGPYCMMLVRQVYLEQDVRVWDSIGARIAEAGTGQVGGGLWQRTGDRIKSSRTQEDQP